MARASSGRPSAAHGGKTKVVLDSSFLIAVMERPTPWAEDITEKLGGFDPVVLASVRRELEGLARRGDKRGRFAALGLELLGAGRLGSVPDGGGSPDDEIISFALREGAVVATIDSDLGERLRASRVRGLVTLRQGRVSLD